MRVLQRLTSRVGSLRRHGISQDQSFEQFGMTKSIILLFITDIQNMQISQS